MLPFLFPQPIVNYNEWRLFYFISFLLLVGFFVLNMFVAVVVENFHKCSESQEKEEKARRAAKRAKKLEKKRRSESTDILDKLVEMAGNKWPGCLPQVGNWGLLFFLLFFIFAALGVELFGRLGE